MTDADLGSRNSEAWGVRVSTKSQGDLNFAGCYGHVIGSGALVIHEIRNEFDQWNGGRTIMLFAAGEWNDATTLFSSPGEGS